MEWILYSNVECWYLSEKDSTSIVRTQVYLTHTHTYRERERETCVLPKGAGIFPTQIQPSDIRIQDPLH